MSDPFLPPEQGGTELLLIRHGDAVPDHSDVAPSRYDEQPLSALGQRQAHALAARLRSVPLAAIYSSPILRARQTAEIIADPLALSIALEPDLREVDLREVRSAPLAEPAPAERETPLHAYLHTIEALALQVGIWSDVPGVESSASVRQRVTSVLHRLAARHPGERIAVVSHNGAINAGIAAFLEVPRDFFCPLANTAISTIRLQGEQHLVLTLNDHAHLTPWTMEQPRANGNGVPKRRFRFWRAKSPT